MNANLVHSEENNDLGKKSYVTPDVIVHGKVENITAGPDGSMGGSLEDNIDDRETVPG